MRRMLSISRALAMIPRLLDTFHLLGILALCCAYSESWSATPGGEAPHGVSRYGFPKPYLNMPETAAGAMPALLSQTGVFDDVRSLRTRKGLLPYDLVVAFWSDGAKKSRWVSVPGKVGFSAGDSWTFPAGTVFVKTFELVTDQASNAARRLETRLLVRDNAGGVYGVVYKWRADGSDADLLSGSQTEDIYVKSSEGGTHAQTWYYPSREDCMACHTAAAGGVLGVKTRQMNRSLKYASGVFDNQLRAWKHAGLFANRLEERQLAHFPTLAAADDESRTLEDRARSYLDANCSQCHRPGGTVASFDARYDTPLDKQQLVDGPILINEGIDKARVIAPHDIWRSIAYMRVNTTDDIRMPPLARETIDSQGVRLLGRWIDSLPGRQVLAPPTISPAGGMFKTPVEVTLTSDIPGTDIHYTLDGSVPGTTDPRYAGPLKLDASTVLRTRAFKEGFTRSITAQQTFIVGR